MRKLSRTLLLVVMFAIPAFGIPLDVFGLPDSLGSVNRILGLALVFVWLLSVARRGSIRELHPFHLVTLLFLIWNALSLLWAGALDLGITKVQRYVQGVGLTLVLWDLVREREDLHAVLQAFVYGGIVSIILVVYDYTSGAVSVYAAQKRASTFGFDPNDLACQLALIIPIAFYLFLARQKASLFLRIVNITSAIAAGGAIFLTGSRTAMIAAVIAFLGTLISARKLSMAWKMVFVLVVVIAVTFVTSIGVETPTKRFESIASSSEDDGLAGRTDLWTISWRMFQAEPIVGIGVGQFEYVGPSFGASNDVVHNSYLSVLTETGLIGFGCFALILLIVAYNALAGLSSGVPTWIQCFTIWMIAAFALTWEYVPQTWLVFGLIVTAQSVYHRPPVWGTSEPADRESLIFRWAKLPTRSP